MSTTKVIRLELSDTPLLRYRSLAAQMPPEGLTKEKEIDAALVQVALALTQRVVKTVYGDDRFAPADAEQLFQDFTEQLEQQVEQRIKQEQAAEAARESVAAAGFNAGLNGETHPE